VSGTTVDDFMSDGTATYAATSGGVYFSPDSGISWSPRSNGLVNDQVTSLAMNGTSIFAGTTFGLYVSNDDGESWTIVDSMSTSQISALVSNSGKVFAGTSGQGVFISTDNGGTWAPADSGLKSLAITGFTISGGNVFVGTSGQGVYSYTGGVPAWSAVNPGLTNTAITCLASKGTNLFAGTAGGPYTSTASSINWNPITDSGQVAVSINAIAASGPYLFCGTNVGPYLSTDNGNTWESMLTGLPLNTQGITALAISGSNAFAGAYQGGVWVGSLTGITAIDAQPSQIPAAFALSQNYPNPFNPTTVIRYQLSAPCFVVLKVYDVLGREVATLEDAKKSTGIHEVEFNGAHLASGVYFYRLAAAGFSETKKMLLHARMRACIVCPRESDRKTKHRRKPVFQALAIIHPPVRFISKIRRSILRDMISMARAILAKPCLTPQNPMSPSKIPCIPRSWTS
jgi:hypothetical protein